MLSPKFNNHTPKRPGSGVNSPLDAEGRTALHLAVAKNDYNEAMKLIRVGAHPDQPDKNGQGPVFHAIANGSIEMVTLLTERGAKLNLRDDRRRSPLEWAIEQKCDVPFIAKLEELGADLKDVAPRTKRSAMHAAAEKDRPDVIAWLSARRGLSLNEPDESGNTPIIIAAQAKSLAALKTLMDLHADPTLRNENIESALHVAAREGDAAVIDQLLTSEDVRRHINDHRTYREGFSPLMVAADNNQAEVVKKLVAVGADVNQLDNRKRNSLFIAADRGHVETARALLELGADAAKLPRGRNNNAPLVHEIGNPNYAEMLVLLYQAGIDLNAVDASGQTALNKACDDTSLDKVRALLALGADPNIPNNMGRRPLDTVMDHYSYGYGNFGAHDHNDIIAELLKRGASPQMSPTPEMTRAPLHLAAENGNVKSLELLLAHGAKIDETDRGEAAETPLMAAAERGQTRAAQFLASKGAKLDATDANGRTVLHYVAAGGAKELAEILLQKGADIEVTDKRGRTPLHAAASGDKRQTMEFLLQKGADPLAFDNDGLTPMHLAMVDSYNNDVFDVYVAVLGDKAPLDAPTRGTGETPLHFAAKNGRQWSVDKLLVAGADPLIAAKDGRLAIEDAVQNGNAALVNSLVRAMQAKGFDFENHRDAQGDSLLHRAVTSYDDTPVMYLLGAGVPVDARNAAGETPLMIAIKNGMMSNVSLLLQRGADVMATSTSGESVFELAMQSERKDIIQNVIMAVQQRQMMEAQQRAMEEAAKAEAEAEKAAKDEPKGKAPAKPAKDADAQPSGKGKAKDGPETEKQETEKPKASKPAPPPMNKPPRNIPRLPPGGPR